MSEVVVWMAVSVVLIFFVFFETMFILFSSPKWLFRMFKYRFLRGKGYAWLLKVDNSGAIRWGLTKLKSNIVKFGKGEEADQSQISQIFHYEADSGVPIHVVVQGTPTNVNLNAKYAPSENAILLNQAMARFYNAGLITGQNMALKPKINTTLIVLLIVVLFAVVVAAFFGYQSWQILKSAVKAGALVGT